jgi:uncharacterized protein (DUF2252 family)
MLVCRDEFRPRAGVKEGDMTIVESTTPAKPTRKATSGRSRSAEAPHPTLAERVAKGKAARAQVPRSSHGDFEPAADRVDPIDHLERQAESRVQELVPIRYGRMLVSPLTFYRGAALIMAADLVNTPTSGLHAQLCGDAHLSNFGVFASPERRLVFDINDFDETLPGPWEWDVKRLAASFAAAGRENGYKPKERQRIVVGGVAAYRQAMATFAGMRNLDVWYTNMEIEDRLSELRKLATKRMLKRTEATLAKARTKDSMQVFSKLTHEVDGEPRIISDPPLIEPIAELAKGVKADQLREGLHEILRSYRTTLQHDRRLLLEEFRMVDVARKVVGVGSVGTRAYVALLLGRGNTDPLFLQLKEAQSSVLEEFVAKSDVHNCGERVVNGQHLMQASSDIFLGWCHVTSGLDGQERDFYGRQLKDWKGSVEVEQMLPQGMEIYAQMCGWTLARAHARSGDRIAIAAYLGNSDSFDQAIGRFAEAYADQNERDYQALLDAVTGGRLKATTGI